MAEIAYRHEVPFGHRLINHAGKCRFPHGHNYLFEVAVMGRVDENGMVLDFSVLKKMVREFLEPFDHAFVLHEKDPLVDVFRYQRSVNDRNEDNLHGIPTKVVLLNAHPTAENLARLLCGGLQLPHDLRVTCYEQRDCWATEWRHICDVQIVDNW